MRKLGYPMRGTAPWREAFETQLAQALRFAPVADEWSPAQPTEKVVKIVRAIAETISNENVPLPMLTSSSDGGLHLKLSKGKRTLSVLVFPDGDIEYLPVENGHPVDDPLNPCRLNDFLNWLLE